MARLIDADDMIKFLPQLEAVNGSDSCNRITNNALHDVFPELIKCAPTIDAVPVVHGTKITRLNDLFSEKIITVCSECSGRVGKRDVYCRHCGAKMDLDD